MTEPLDPDLKMAAKFLKRLDPSTDKFTFLVYDDDQDRASDSRRKTYNGTFKEFADKLIMNNRAGSSICVTVNRTNLKGRKMGDMKEVRAVWHEDDISEP